MQIETIIEVVNELIGDIDPIGEAHEDYRRYLNLQAARAVAESLTRRLLELSEDRDRDEYSIKRAGKYAYSWVKKTMCELREEMDYDED